MIARRGGVVLALGAAMLVTPGAAMAQQPGETPPDGWTEQVCIAVAGLDSALAHLSDLGQAALRDDVAGIASAVAAADTAAQPAADALDAAVMAWPPGMGLVNSLRSSVFGVLSLENSIADAAAADDPAGLRGAIGDLVQAYRWRLESEALLTELVDGIATACAGVAMPSLTAGPIALSELFPAQLGGAAPVVQTASGTQLLAGAPAELREPVETFLAGAGKTADDLEAALARIGPSHQLLALRVSGEPADGLLEALTPLLSASFADPRATPTTIDAVNVVILSDGPPDGAVRRLVMIVDGEVLWSIRAEGDALGEVLAALG